MIRKRRESGSEAMNLLGATSLTRKVPSLSRKIMASGRKSGKGGGSVYRRIGEALQVLWCPQGGSVFTIRVS